MVSLRAFLDSLSEEQFLRIKESLDLDYTPTAMVLELEKQQKFPCLYIEQPQNFDMPVVANLFADRDRIAQMVGANLPADFNETWLHAKSNPVPAKIVDSGPVQEMVITGDEVDVGLLPISRHFEQDAGRYIGSGILACKDPDTGVRNLSYQRLQMKGKNRFGASLHSRGHIWDHLMRREAQGQNLEVAVVLGAHPVAHLAAGAKWAMEIDEFDIAGGC